MKLMYDLPDIDKKVYDDNVGKDEKLMYCLPFNIHGTKFVTGYVAFTDKKMYKILDGQLLGVYPIIGSQKFKTEVMYGSCGFYAEISGSYTLICQFI